jgi:hypothetical protein
MSSMAFVAGSSGVFAAFERDGDVRFKRVAADGPSASPAIGPPGDTRNRKHPRLAVNRAGQVLLVWTEGTAWARGGSLAWRVFGPDGRPLTESGVRADVPTWSFGAAAAHADGTFTIFY